VPRSEPEFVVVARLDELAPDTVKAVRAGGRSILLCHSEGRVYAVENVCSHVGEPLECGRMKRGWIACPTHGSRFDLETGEPLNPPATEPIATFPVRVEGGVIAIAA
jgi:3-phenylpropionate/trans-cinnamate dioxygenase ferredoxin component